MRAIACPCRCLLQRGSCCGHCFLKPDWALGSGVHCRPPCGVPRGIPRHHALDLVVFLRALGACLFPKHLFRFECTDQCVHRRWYSVRAFSQDALARVVAAEAQSRLAPICFRDSRSCRLLCTSCRNSSMKLCGSPASWAARRAASAFFKR